MGDNVVLGRRALALWWYGREDVQGGILRSCGEEREVAGRYHSGGFGKRPDMLMYPADVHVMARGGMTSFHFSVERWNKPTMLRPGMSDAEQATIRTGFDVVVELDPGDIGNFGHCTKAAIVFVNILRESGLGDPRVKFSGNKGWHVPVPWEWFPPTFGGVPTAHLFPKVSRYVLTVLAERARPRLDEAFSRTLPPEEYDAVGRDPFRVVEVDMNLSHRRHLIRAPYSLHEATGLVSVPVPADGILGFQKADARPTTVRVNPSWSFWAVPEAERSLGAGILREAVALMEADKGARVAYSNKFAAHGLNLGEAFDPPCVRFVLRGMEDGRKRCAFLLMSYWRCLGRPWGEVVAMAQAWNVRNRPSLKKSELRRMVEYLKENPYTMPNCDHPIYTAVGVCQKDATCKCVKNPLSYSGKMWRQELDGVSTVVKTRRKGIMLTKQGRRRTRPHGHGRSQG